MISSILYTKVPVGFSHKHDEENVETATHNIVNSQSLIWIQNSYFFDKGATWSLIDLLKFNPYCQQYILSMKRRPRPHSLRFVTGICQSQGNFNSPITLPSQSYLKLKTCTVRIDIPFLIGLDRLLYWTCNNDWSPWKCNKNGSTQMGITYI